MSAWVYGHTVTLQGSEMTNLLVSYFESVISKYECGKASALDLGCGPGYTSLMLSRTFDSVRERYINSHTRLFLNIKFHLSPTYRWLGLIIVGGLSTLPLKFTMGVW